MLIGSYRLMVGDVLEKLQEIPDRSVHCVVTSPPYWGLRNYGAEGQIGLEPTMGEHFDKLSAVFQEVRRVLRDDGTMWVNYGDAYGQAGGPCKAKDLLMLPARLAIRLQEDGWWVRSEIVWSKPNPMPESCRDRPTSAHEKVFLLAKSARYFYDLEAVRQPCSEATVWTYSITGGKATQGHKGSNSPTSTLRVEPSNGANLRNVWTIPTEKFPDAHFATYPQALVKPCILAGTSERGACPECGAPWVRQVEVERSADNYYVTGKAQAKRDQGLVTALSGYGPSGPPARKFLGWSPTCNHGHEPVPCVVLDPFNGSGTTGVVALRHGRSYLGCELNPDYARMAEERLQRASKGLDPKREAQGQETLFGPQQALFEEEDTHGRH